MHSVPRVRLYWQGVAAMWSYLDIAVVVLISLAFNAQVGALYKLNPVKTRSLMKGAWFQPPSL